jgi:iron(III) transport system ATP-binding protein
LGPSGCGKTTTLRLVAGFIDPDEGTIRVGGRTVSEPGRSLPPERRRMSMIFQSYALWPHMTIAENVGFSIAANVKPRPDHLAPSPFALQLTCHHGALASLRGRRQAAS